MVEKKQKQKEDVNQEKVTSAQSQVSPQPDHAQKKKSKKSTVVKKAVVKKDFIHVRGKRKEAIARITLKEGKGRLFINKRALDSYDNEVFKNLVLEPLILTETHDKFDIYVNVRSGGVMGQAQAIRRAIATALLNYYDNNEHLRKQMLDYDRTLLVEDYRRVEPKKYKGRKARARFQKSYR